MHTNSRFLVNNLELIAQQKFSTSQVKQGNMEIDMEMVRCHYLQPPYCPVVFPYPPSFTNILTLPSRSFFSYIRSVCSSLRYICPVSACNSHSTRSSSSFMSTSAGSFMITTPVPGSSPVTLGVSQAGTVGPELPDMISTPTLVPFPPLPVISPLATLSPI